MGGGQGHLGCVWLRRRSIAMQSNFGSNFLMVGLGGLAMTSAAIATLSLVVIPPGKVHFFVDVFEIW